MSRTRVLLINPPIREAAPPSSIPIGLASIAAVLRNAGHDVDVLDVNGLRMPFEQVQRRLAGRPYDLVAAGGLITTYAYLKKLFPAIRRAQPEALLVIGGGVCVEPDVVLENLDVDLCVIGEGEYTMRDLAEAVGDRPDWKEIPGLAWRGPDGVAWSDPRPLEKDLDRFPLPAYDLLPVAAYNANVFLSGEKSEVNIITSRGCPWDCSFCWHIFGRGMRLRGVEAVLDEIQYFREKHGIASILFADENFTANRKRLVELCEGLIRAGHSRLPWMCSGRADTVDDEVLKIMRRAGCYRVNFGVESGCQRLLDSMNKRIKKERVAEAIGLCRKHRIIPGGTLIFGMPGEDESSIGETVAFCRAHRLATGMFFATPYPGTDLYKDPEVFRKILARYGTKDAFFTVLGDAKDYVINLTDLPDDEMMRLKVASDRQTKYQSVFSMARIGVDSLRSRGWARTARLYWEWVLARLRR